jgi:hypothetical protein
MAKKRTGGDEDELLEPLYAAAPREFVAERARVAAALKAAGRGDDARRVAKMKRPSASVWAVNQLARQAGDEIEALLALGARLRKGERVLLGGGDAAGFMEEARTARQKVAALARQAEAIVEQGGQKPTLALGRKIAATLQAASLGDDETRARLQAGRLDQDLAPPSSFGAEGADLSGALAASLGSAKPKTSAKTHATKTSRAETHAHAAAERKHADERTHADERKHAAAERKRAAADLRTQRRAQAAARKHAATLARAATAAERAVAERARAVEHARAAVERAEADLRAAKDALVEAELAAAAARRAADAAAAAAR